MRTVLVAGCLLLGACASDGESTPPGPQIVVTTNILGDVVEHLVGDQADVEVIMPPNADPHDFAPSPKQAEAMREADLLVVNGEGFEGGLDDTIEAAEADGATIIRATDAVELRPFVEDGEEGLDPHVFTSPANMVTIAQAITDRLVDEVPALDTAAFRDHAAEYIAELDFIDLDVQQILQDIPPERRKLVTNHDVFGYFADRYDFEVLGAVIPGGSTLAEPSSRELSDLATLIDEAGVPAIFADTSSPSLLADALAGEGTDVQVVELFSESLGGPGSGAETYIDMQRTNAHRIADALE